MKVFLIITALIVFVAGIRFLYLAKVSEHIAKNARDGSKGFHQRKKKKAVNYRVSGTGLIIAGIVCLVFGLFL